MHKFYWLSLFLFINGCHPSQKASEDIATMTGDELAKVHCVTCHEFPEPTLLPQETWERYVLPRMGYLMGFYDNQDIREELLEDGDAKAHLIRMNVFPESPSMDTTIWEKIKSYYLEEAPESFEFPQTPTIDEELRLFKVRYPNTQLSPPSSTMVMIGENKKLFVSDAHTRSMLVFDHKMILLQVAKVGEAATHLHSFADSYLLTVMGSFSPTDRRLGKLVLLPKKAEAPAQVLLSDLQRPVYSSISDLDDDGLTDLVVCEFGKWTGGLNWFRNLGNGKYQKFPLKTKPGAIKSEILDLNEDGFLDIIALFGQADEGMYVFYNDGDGNFTENRLLTFSPSHGSSSFELIDFNQDGLVDILYTAGDNADYRPISKPYHGIYIYQNTGDNEFVQSTFLHYNGAYQANALDFDMDGDLDIAAVSFFPDYDNESDKGFLFFENLGNEEFRRSTFHSVAQGRWMVMDCGDLDQDGDQDIVLGSLAFEVVDRPELVNGWAQKGLPFIFLENQIINPSDEQLSLTNSNKLNSLNSPQ